MKSFEVQMFASPGIRKDERDEQELGEDATGFVVKNNYVVLWVADGAPGTNIRTGANIKLEGLNFNSRVLAKYLGSSFETVALKDEIPENIALKDETSENITLKDETHENVALKDEMSITSSKEYFYEIFYEEFKCELQRELSNYLELLCKRLKQNKESIPCELLVKRTIGEEIFYEFELSGTFVGVILDIEKKACYTMSIGDSVAVVNDKVITDQSNRVFAVWRVKESFDSSTIKVITKKPNFEIIHDVNSIILMSDGVIDYNEIVQKLGNRDADVIWNELKFMNNKTDDDKTAVFFMIKG